MKGLGKIRLRIKRQSNSNNYDQISVSLFEHVQHHRKAVLFSMVLLIAAGIMLFLQMPVGLFPDITFPRVVILVDNGEQPTERMMVEVTKPIESAISAVPGVKLVRSITSRGSAEINVFLEWGSDVQLAMQLIQGQIANARNALPAAANINVQQMTVSVFPIEGYSLTSTTKTPVELRDIATTMLKPALQEVAGVARVEITGGDTREFSVTIDPTRLASYHLDVRQVGDAIQKTNLIESSGLVENNYQLYLSLVSGALQNVDDIRSVVVTTQNGVPITINDIASVRPTIEDQYIRTTAAGRDAALLTIMKQPTGSTVQIGDDVKAKLASLKLPAGVHLENFYDQSAYINDSIASTRDSILIGIALAMLVLLLFLRSWRITLVIAIIVPATIACTFIFLNLIGETVNIMTLGGIAAAVGLIIDDSIVIIESIFTHFAIERAKATDYVFLRAAGASLKEMMPAILGSTASTIVIHVPLGFLTGVTGAFFKPLSITMVFALVISFIFSITLAPLLASMVLRSKDIEREIRKEQEEKKSSVYSLYESTMSFLLRIPWLAIPIVVVIFFLTYLIYTQLGSSFMPEMDEGTFVLDYVSPAGTSLTETNRMLTNVEQVLLKVPEVESYSRRTGTQLGFFLTEPNTGDYTVKLKSQRSRSTEDVISEVRTKVERIEPRLQIDFGQLLQDVIGDLTNSPSPIEIKLFGTNTTRLQSLANQVKDAIESVPGVVDAANGIVISGPSLIVHVDSRQASFYGLTVTDVQDQLETIMSGKVPSTVPLPDKVVGIRVRYPVSYKSDLDSLSSVYLTGQGGILVPLRSIASITRTAGQPEIDREGSKPYIAVTARVEGRDLGSTIADIQKKLARTIHLPSGVTLAYGGVYETQQESFRNLVIVALIAFLLVFLTLLIEFREFSVPGSILLVTLLSLVGVMLALWITGMTLNISSLVGMIMIIGIVAENAVFIIHYAKMPGHQSQGLAHALISAARHRARPIIMTTLAAILALLPLALGIGTGAAMQQPLAIAVIGGFSISSIMLFFILPMLYVLLHGKSSPPQPQILETSATTQH